MKYIIIIPLLFGLLFTGCKEEEIMNYESVNYLQFGRSTSDSLVFSFMFYPGEEERAIALPLDLMGYAPLEDQVYKLEVNDEFTTAVQGTHFELPERLVFRAGHFVDTCFVRVKLTEDLKTNPVRLVLNLRDNEHFLVGQPENRSVVIWITNVVSKPDWWTDDITSSRLGAYSDKKYELFIQVNKVADLTGASESEIRYYSLQLKYHLEAEKAAGRTVTEKNGDEMTVNVLG